MIHYRVELQNTVLFIRWDEEGVKGNDGLPALCRLYPRSKISRISEKQWQDGRKVPKEKQRARKAQKKRK